MSADPQNDTSADHIPWLSIVIPTRDGTSTLENAVRSALGHSSNLEVVVIDDGSEPAVDRARLPRDPRLVLARYDGIGVSAARNEGARRARGDALAFLDDDDVLLDGWHDAVMTALADETVGAACVGVRVIDASTGSVTNRYPRSMGPLFGDREGLFLAGSFAVRARLFADVDGYDEALDFSENNELSIRLVRATIDAGRTIACMDGPHTEITRRGVGQRRTGVVDRQRAAEHILRIHHELLRDHPVARAGYARVAGVSAVQSGDVRAARRWFATTVRATPLSVTDWARLGVSLIAPIARVVWGAPGRRDADRTPPV